jgi:adenylate kinase family enzyme
MRKYLIMGVQGSGKGTQAKMLAEAFDLVHIAVGDIFRWNVQNHTKIGAQVRRTMAAGSLVGDDLVEGVVGYGCASTTGTTASSSTASRATSARRSSSWRATTSTG